MGDIINVSKYLYKQNKIASVYLSDTFLVCLKLVLQFCTAVPHTTGTSTSNRTSIKMSCIFRFQFDFALYKCPYIA